MPRIAISYRRADSSAITGRIFDHLRSHFGADSVFMDIDDIPFGVDFRNHIHEVLMNTDVLIAVIGSNWIGRDATGAVRIQDEKDPVRVEIETALELGVLIIPVLIDGAKMPISSDLPEGCGNFPFVNAAEVASGRDFRTHMDRLIRAIDRTPALRLWHQDWPRYLAVPLVLLLVAHYALINAFDLNIIYLQIVCAVVPFAFGYALYWQDGRGAAAAIAFAVVLGITATAAMTVSQSLNSGAPIMPQTRVEWRENIQFAGTIVLTFMAGHALARALHATLRRKFGKP